MCNCFLQLVGVYYFELEPQIARQHLGFFYATLTRITAPITPYHCNLELIVLAFTRNHGVWCGMYWFNVMLMLIGIGIMLFGVFSIIALRKRMMPSHHEIKGFKKSERNNVRAE